MNSPSLIHWYRYEDYRSDEGPARIVRYEFRVLRETRAGVWLDVWGKEKFVLKIARKRYAYPTDELARNSFEIRKKKQLGYLVASHDYVAEIVRRIDEGTIYDPPQRYKLFPDWP